MVPIVPFEACLAKLAAAEALDDFRGHGVASKTVRAYGYSLCAYGYSLCAYGCSLCANGCSLCR